MLSRWLMGCKKPGVVTTVTLTSGSTWTRPADCPNVLDKVECWGGGAASRDLSSGADPGGGGGAYASKSNYDIGSQTSISIQIPGQSVSSNPSDTWFDNSSTGVLAKSGARPANATTGGVGGQASSCVGTIKYSGGNGGTGYATNGGGGGGGGSATKNGAGSTGGSTSSATGGGGGNAGSGGGGGGSASAGAGTDNVEGGGGGAGRGYLGTSADTLSGGAGGAPGGGGGGRCSDVSGSAGFGARGQIRITYTSL